MILGIGVDIVDVRRFESIMFQWRDRFIKRVFTDKEIRYCNTKKHPAQRFATRFACKQAFIKAAFPRGQKGVRFCDIEIDQKDQRPVINLSGLANELVKKSGIKNIHLMLSHDGDYGDDDPVFADVFGLFVAGIRGNSACGGEDFLQCLADDVAFRKIDCAFGHG